MPQASPPTTTACNPIDEHIGTGEPAERATDKFLAETERQVQAIEAEMDVGIHDIPATSTATAKKKLRLLEKMAFNAGVFDAAFRFAFITARNLGGHQ